MNTENKEVLDQSSGLKKFAIMIIFLILIAIAFALFQGPEYDKYMKSDRWTYKANKNDRYHDPLRVVNIQETEDTLSFNVPCHMTLKNKSTRKCTFFYALNKKTGEGTYYAEVTGHPDNGTPVVSGRIYLENINDDELTFVSITDPSQTWTRLISNQSDNRGGFKLIAR